MIVLDSGILIAYANPEDAHHRGVLDLLWRVSDESFSVTALTLAEALIHPVRADIVGDMVKVIATLDLYVEDLREQDAVALARVRAATGLKMPDALVVHTAERFGGSVATTDARLAAAAEGRGLLVHQI
jgi:predicted nucleic acid-binding protein